MNAKTIRDEIARQGQQLRDIRAEARRAVLAELRAEVTGLAFEFDDVTPRRFMVERAEVLAAIDRLTGATEPTPQ